MNRLDKQYQELLDTIIKFGVDKNTRNGKTKSIFGYTIRHNMKDGFPLLTTKKMAWKQIVTELLWFLNGDTNIKFLLDNDCHIWDGDAYKNYLTKGEKLNKQTGGVPDYYTKEEFINKIKTDDEFAKKWGDLGPIYGKQWRSWDKLETNNGQSGINKLALFNGPHQYFLTQIDQITNLISELKTNPDSRRLMVSAWNVGELDQMVLPPCHYGFQVYTRELSSQERKNIYDKSSYAKDIFPTDENGWNSLFDDCNIPTRAISLMWNQRSVDTFLGLPFNIASYGLLLQMLATEVGMVPDGLIGNLGDVHLYADHIEQAKEQMEREPFDLPTVFINTEFWQTESGDCGVGPLASNLKGIEEGDFRLMNYQSHPAIKAPLSN